jgi:beta-barrel assembly-enhancing protease
VNTVNKLTRAACVSLALFFSPALWADTLPFMMEWSLGKQLAMESMKEWGLPIKNKKIHKYVNFTAVAVGMNSLRPHMNYRVVILDNEKIKARGFPGGLIVITKGLLKTLANEAELAGVLAHHIAHITHRHDLKTLEQSPLSKTLKNLDATNPEHLKSPPFQKAVTRLKQSVFRQHAHTKHMALEADNAAVESLYRTGYDPRSLLHVLKKNRPHFAKARIKALKQKLADYDDLDDTTRVAKRFKKRIKKLK